MESKPITDLGEGMHIHLVRGIHDWRGILIFLLVGVSFLTTIYLIDKKYSSKSIGVKKLNIITIILLTTFLIIWTLLVKIFPKYF